MYDSNQEIFNEFQPDGIDTSRVADSDIGPLLHDRIARFLVGLDVPRGLNAIGYKVRSCCGRDGGRTRLTERHQDSDIGELVLGTLPQRRVLDLARKLLEHALFFTVTNWRLSSWLLGQRWTRGAVADH